MCIRDSPSSLEVETTTVTAKKRVDKITDAPASIELVSAKDIKREESTNLGGYLKGLKGVDFTASGVNNYSISVRGFNSSFSSRLLTLTDGRVASIPALRVVNYSTVPQSSKEIESIEVLIGPATAIFYAVKETWFVIGASWEFVISMFKGTGDTSQLGGPIKIAKISGQVAKLGFIAFLSIMAYISISLGFINLFPIPMLDGGHLMFYAFEKILGRPLTQRTQEGFFRIGLFLLLSLMFFTTFNDLKDLGLF